MEGLKKKTSRKGLKFTKCKQISRRRFIRLLIADGFSRNAAHSAARLVQRAGASYAEVYQRYLIALIITSPYDLNLSSLQSEALAYSIEP